MADAATAALGAIIGICVALVICVIALIIFVVIFCNLKLKDDTNVRKRLIANDAFEEEQEIVETPSARAVIEQPMYPPSRAPVVVPPTPMPVPPQPTVLPRVQPPPPPQPRMVVRDMEPLPPQPQREVVRRRSWAGEDDWVLVKKITRRRHRSSDSESSTSSDSSYESHHHCRPRGGVAPMMMPMMTRLAPYDLAIPRPAAPAVTPIVIQPFM